MTVQRFDRDPGQTVREKFSTKLPGGALTDQFRHKTNGIGDPAFELRRRSDDVAASIQPTVTINHTFGIHKMVWDSGSDAILEDYDLFITDGEVNDGTQWVDVTGQVVVSLSLNNTASGRLSQRIVRILEGTVISVTSSKQFIVEITGRDHSQAPYNTPNLYARLGLSFQSGTLMGISKNILRSSPSAANTTLILQHAFPLPPSPGDQFCIIPEEQVAPIPLAHITAVPHTGEYYAHWSKDGILVLPDNNQCFITATVIDTGQNLFSDQQMLKNTLWSFYHADAVNLPPPNSAVEILVYGLFDGTTTSGIRPYPRTA